MAFIYSEPFFIFKMHEETKSKDSPSCCVSPVSETFDQNCLEHVDRPRMYIKAGVTLSKLLRVSIYLTRKACFMGCFC